MEKVLKKQQFLNQKIKVIDKLELTKQMWQLWYEWVLCTLCIVCTKTKNPIKETNLSITSANTKADH